MALSPERHTLLTLTAGTRIGMPAFDRRLAARYLTLAGHQHLTHDHVVDLVGSDAGALEGGADGDGPEVGRRERGEAPDSFPIGVRAPATMSAPMRRTVPPAAVVARRRTPRTAVGRRLRTLTP